MKSRLKKITAILYLSLIMTALLAPSIALADDFWDEGGGGAINQMNEDTAATAPEGGTGGDPAALGDENGGDGGVGEQQNTEAVDTGDAIKDIMDNDRFKGAISSISWLTDITDKYFAMAITLVAFFIISASLLKNACAGAYCANPKFWNKVHQAHQKSDAYTLNSLKNFFGQRGYMEVSPSSIMDFILGILPDLQSFTDFENEDVDPKQYFMRSIPQMIMCVIIGVFIYNGYYRDTASVVGSFGAETFERVMASADPVGLADRLYNSTGTPKVASDYDNSPSGKLTNDITHATYKAVMSQYTDINGKNAKSALINSCEATAQDITAALSAYVGTEDGASYKNTISVHPSATMIEDRDSSYQNGHTYERCVDAYSDYNLAEYSNKDELHYVIIAVNSTRIVKGSDGGNGGVGAAVGVGTITYNIGSNDLNTTNGVSTTNKDITIAIDGATRYVKVTNKIDVNTQSNTCTLRKGTQLPVTTSCSNGSYGASVKIVANNGGSTGPNTSLSALIDAYKKKNGLSNQDQPK